jgi:hypothetical protein
MKRSRRNNTRRRYMVDPATGRTLDTWTGELLPGRVRHYWCPKCPPDVDLLAEIIARVGGMAVAVVLWFACFGFAHLVRWLCS